MKKIMILGAAQLQEPLIEQALKDYTVVLVAPVINNRLRSMVSSYYLEDVTHKEVILEYAKKENIDGIITDQTDIAVRTCAYVSENMGLPSIGYETGVLFTDKGKMREKLQELGIKTLPNKTVKTVEEAIEFFETLNGPAIIKPLDSQGSRGVNKVSSVEELKSKFHDAIENGSHSGVLIEKVATGREFVVESIVVNYEYKTLICGDTYYFDIEDSFSANMRLFPSVADKELVKRVEEMNERIVTGFGLKQGISHSEYIMDGDDIILIETAARGGGVYISSDLISLSTGLNTEDFLCKLCLGEQKELPSFTRNICSCGYMAFYLPTGVVKSVKGIDDVKALPYVHRYQLKGIECGMKVSQSNDKTSRYSIIVDGKNREELEERMNGIRSQIQIEVECEDGVKGPIWY